MENTQSTIMWCNVSISIQFTFNLPYCAKLSDYYSANFAQYGKLKEQQWLNLKQFKIVRSNFLSKITSIEFLKFLKDIRFIFEVSAVLLLLFLPKISAYFQGRIIFYSLQKCCISNSFFVNSPQHQLLASIVYRLQSNIYLIKFREVYIRR